MKAFQGKFGQGKFGRGKLDSGQSDYDQSERGQSVQDQSDDDQSGHKKSRRAKSAKSASSVSSHPLFPAIVALWFAALFGFGSMVLPTILIERAVDTIGLPSLIGATAPPLGFTAKLMIACAAALFGAALGFFIARKVVSSQTAEKPRRRGVKEPRPSSDQKRPISASEELGSETLDTPIDGAPKHLGGRRRELASKEAESGPSEWLQQAPVPGMQTQSNEANEALDLTQEARGFAAAAAPEAITPQIGSPEPFDGSEDLEEIPFMRAEAKASFPPVDNPVEQGPTDQSDELRFQPVANAKTAEPHFASKQVFKPQEAEPMGAVSPSVSDYFADPATEETLAEENFAETSYQAAAPVNDYKAELQQGMPRLKIEPDPEPDEYGSHLGFNPLGSGADQEETPVNPELEARLSGLRGEEEREIAPTSMLENTLRTTDPEEAETASQVPETNKPETNEPETNEEVPLAFSPPSLGKAKPDMAPEPVSQAEPEPQAANHASAQFAQPTVNAATRPFDMPKGFENSEEIGSAPSPFAQFDPMGQIDDELDDGDDQFESEQFPTISSLQVNPQDFQAQVTEPEVEPEIEPVVEPEIEQTFAPAAEADMTEEMAEDMNSDVAEEMAETGYNALAAPAPINEKSLSALGTVELIERLAKSVRERSSDAPETPAGLSLPDVAKAFDEVSDENEAAPTELASEQFEAEAEQPEQVEQASAEDDFLPIALKPIDLHLDDAFVAEDADDTEMPLSTLAELPETESAEDPSQIVPPAPQLSPFAEPIDDVPQERPFASAPFGLPSTSDNRFAALASGQSADEEDDDDVEEPFGSLLELRNRLTQPQEFVRIEQEPTDDSIEPAVIFPGQDGQATPRSMEAAFEAPEESHEQHAAEPHTAEPNSGGDARFGADTSEPEAEPTPVTPDEQQDHNKQDAVHPFAPTSFTRRPMPSDASPMPSAPAETRAQAAPAAKDPAETERALRSALATLQRMSGTA